MVMTDSEIVAEYSQSKSKKEQIQILADENLCKPQDIINVLCKNGYDRRSFNHYVAKEKSPADWRQAIQIISDKIAELTQLRDSADAELQDIITALSEIA